MCACEFNLQFLSLGLDIGFGQDDYTQIENLGPVSVEVLKEETNSGDVTVRITPFTFEQFDNAGFTLPDPLQNMNIDPAECKGHFNSCVLLFVQRELGNIILLFTYMCFCSYSYYCCKG